MSPTPNAQGPHGSDGSPGSDAITDELPLAYRKGGSTEGLLPIIGYFVGENIGSRFIGDEWGDRLAIILMTAAAGWAVLQRKRRGDAIGWWIPTIAIYLFLRGIAGLIWGEDVFLGIGIALKVGLGLAALISVLIAKPIAAKLAPMVLPFSDSTQAHPRYLRTMGKLTLGYAIYQLVTVGFEIWLLGETESGSGFLLIRTAIGMVGGFVGFLAAAFYAERSLRGIPGFPGVMQMFEDIGMQIEADRAKRKNS